MKTECSLAQWYSDRRKASQETWFWRFHQNRDIILWMTSCDGRQGKLLTPTGEPTEWNVFFWFPFVYKGLSMLWATRIQSLAPCWHPRRSSDLSSAMMLMLLLLLQPPPPCKATSHTSARCVVMRLAATRHWRNSKCMSTVISTCNWTSGYYVVRYSKCNISVVGWLTNSVRIQCKGNFIIGGRDRVFRQSANMTVLSATLAFYHSRSASLIVICLLLAWE